MLEAIEDLTVANLRLKNLGQLNIILGKNGCGKSTVLRQIDTSLPKTSNIYGTIRYLSPQRGGVLRYEPSVESSIAANPQWLRQVRSTNVADQFKQQTMVSYKKLELSILRDFEQNQSEKFDYYIQTINSLLDYIYIKRDSTTFIVYDNSTNTPINLDKISSGESELISLAIEILVFARDVEKDKKNILLIDEPDVHLHPDLQIRLCKMLKEVSEKFGFYIIIATHSTNILVAYEADPVVNVCFMKKGDEELSFTSLQGLCAKILPMLGAHAVSNILNEFPIFLVEGEDDARIWQQVNRTSQGKIKLYPCAAGSVSVLNGYEREVDSIINAVYDTPKAYSLRDSDGIDEEITDLGNVIRFRLKCKAIENLLLTNEVLESLDVKWEDLKSLMDEWINNNSKKAHHETFVKFRAGGYNRRYFDIKEIRNDIMWIIQNNKPWEIAIGAVIAKVRWHQDIKFDSEESIYTYLGEKLIKEIFG